MSNSAVHSSSASDTTAQTAQAARRRDDFAIQPAVDIVEDAQGITLFADLPGVPREQLQLRVDGDSLIVEADMQLDLPEGLKAGHVEVSRQHYRRAFTLSKELDANSVSAELAQGVLRVRIAKAAHAQPRKIDVKLS